MDPRQAAGGAGVTAAPARKRTKKSVPAGDALFLLYRMLSKYENRAPFSVRVNGYSIVT